jgi:hypothetical protein
VEDLAFGIFIIIAAASESFMLELNTSYELCLFIGSLILFSGEL